MSLSTNISNAVKIFPRIIRSEERKSIPKMIWEILYLTVIQRSFPSHYFGRHLYRNEISDIGNYLPNRLMFSIPSFFNDQSTSQVLSNKLFFHKFYGRHTDRLSKLLMYNYNQSFIIGGKAFIINSEEEFERILVNIVTEHSKTNSIFIKKMSDSYGGRSIFRLTKEDFPLEKIKLENLFINVCESAYIFEETIIQHPSLDKLNNSCVNTIRIDSFIDSDGAVETITAFLRMSINNTHVDNASSGGCFVGINLDEGELKELAYTSITRAGGAILHEHPVSGIVFKAYKIPYIKETKELITRLALLVPSQRLIGWDVAIAEDGPVLIEGNERYDITVNDLAYGGYKSHPVFRKVLKELSFKS